jgi:opacity protein-like surface antigen
MKKIILTALVALFLMSAVSMAQVSTPGLPFSVYAGGALSLPSSPSSFSDGWKMGYHGMLGVGFNVAPRVQIIPKLEYHKFGSDLSSYAGPLLDGGGFKSLMFGADARLNLGAPVLPIKPYALGGIGMANVSYDDFTSSDPLVQAALNSGINGASTTQFYFNIGAGAEFTLAPKASLFVQARYVSISGDGGSVGYIPLTVGLKLF